MLTCTEYQLPESLEQALAMLSADPARTRVIAGATDTLPWARQGRAGDVTGDCHVETIVDISRIAGLNGWDAGSGRVRMGANLVFQQFLDDEELAAHLPHMRYCAIWFADDQIRRQATLAGNLANASPAADGTPAMVMMNAEVELARLADGEIERRTVPVASFITGPGKTVLAADEIITAVTCDSATGYGGAFEKVGQRRSLVISVACASCCVKLSADATRFEDIRIALGGVGPTPMRLEDVEAHLRGKEVSKALIAKAAALAPGRVASRSRRAYRAEVVRGFTERAIINALADCRAAPQALLEEVLHG